MANVEIKVISYEEARLSYFKELQERQKKRFEQFEKSSAIKELPPQERYYQLSKMGEVLQYYDDIVKMLAADVVPKSEVESIITLNSQLEAKVFEQRKEIERLHGILLQFTDIVHKWGAKNNIDTSEISLVPILQEEADSIIKKANQELASEIFAEIEKVLQNEIKQYDDLFHETEDPRFKQEYICANNALEWASIKIIELKKRYTEGEQ